MCWTVRVRFSAEARDFSLLHNVQNNYEAYPACYAMSTGSEAAGLHADNLPPSSARIRNDRFIPPPS
jgi:hypothetical protein